MSLVRVFFFSLIIEGFSSPFKKHCQKRISKSDLKLMVRKLDEQKETKNNSKIK